MVYTTDLKSVAFGIVGSNLTTGTNKMKESKMDENLIPRLIALVIIILILSVTSCTITKGNIAANLVEKGADPIAVQCMLYSDPSSPICVVYALSKK